jgi:hypothetical protein
MMEEIMRKHSKFITILLSALLAVCLVQTVFVQAFATEMGDDDFGWGNASTSDEAETVYPVSMEVVKAPESVTVNNGRITDSTFWSNVVLHIVYSNGEEYDVNCDGIDSEDGIVPPIAEIDGYKGKMYYGTNSKNEDTISFYIAYDYAEDDGVTCAVSADFSAEKVTDPHSIVSAEVTKLPDMVFTKPLFTGSRDDISTEEEWNEWRNSLDVNNSISNHIDGMEITYYYANGEKRSVVVNSSNLKSIAFMPWFAMYRVENYGEFVDEYGNYLLFQVDDLGDYKFSVSLGSSDTEMIYTAKSVDNPNPSLNPVSTEDTPAKPEKPSGNISSATSDVATNDNANNNNSTNGTANNGVVATGNFATPAIIATVMILAAAVMFVLKRKHTF